LEQGSSNQLDLSGNHSSEEELEEIITACKRPLYVDRGGENKRKWNSDLSQSEETSCESDADGFEDPELRPQPVVGQTGCDRSTSTSAGSSSCDTLSGDEEVNHNQPTPLQFSTSPPVDVHKPRRSLSPQAGWPPRSVSPPPKLVASPERPPPMGNLSSSLGDLPCLMSTGEDSSSYSSRRRAGPASCYSSSTTTSKKSISPRKRSRTSRVHHIQRPCLDFEKMQQLRAHSVSWRHGGELSLFCW
jgi:hypothetical protein